MGYKCAPQVMGLVRGDTNKKGRGNGSKIFREFGEERASKSMTLDKTRSALNSYEGYTSGGDAWSDICDEADEYRVKSKTKDGKDVERALRKDAVIGWAVIINPPDEMTHGWTQADYDRFYEDSMDALRECGEYESKIFAEANKRMTAKHRDEGMMQPDGSFGEHMHIGGIAKDGHGKFAGNKIDAAMRSRICNNYPRLMRERGWELDDLDVTDWERMGKDENGKWKDPEYRTGRLAHIKAKKRKGGRSVNKYIKDEVQAANDLMGEAVTTYQDAKEYAVELLGQTRELDEREEKLDEREAAVEAREKEAESAKADGFARGQELGKRAAQESVEQTIYAPARRKAQEIEEDAQSAAEQTERAAKERLARADNLLRAVEFMDAHRVIKTTARYLQMNGQGEFAEKLLSMTKFSSNAQRDRFTSQMDTAHQYVQEMSAKRRAELEQRVAVGCKGIMDAQRVREIENRGRSFG